MHEAVVDDRRGRMRALRQLVAEKFPATLPGPAGRLRTGCAALDGRGGLSRGAVTEVCGTKGAGQLVMTALLAAAFREEFFLGLIDGADALEPADWNASELERLLWLRCGEASLALKAADILIRDANLPVLILDLQLLPAGQLRRIPASTWHRFHRVLETGSSILLVLTSQAMVEAAPCRITVRAGDPGTLREEPRSRLLENLETRIFERGRTEIRLSA